MTTVAPTKKKNTKTRRSTGDGVGDGHSVVLFNCTCHTFDSVIAQLMYALSCTYEGARRYAYVVHTNGKATVFTGTQESCDQVADILAEIGLKVRVT